MERKSSFKGVRIDKAKWSIPLIIIVAYVAMGLIVEPLPKILEGLGIIYTSPSQLLTDYFAIAGIGAPLWNSASMVAFMSLVIRATKTPFTGSMISTAFLKFHEGYNLYNVGFAAGIIGMVFMSTFKLFGYEISSVAIISDIRFSRLIYVFIAIYVILLVYGLYIDRKALSKYPKLINNIARSITDYFYEKEATRIIVDIKNEDEMEMKVLANIYLTQKEVDDLLYLMDQPSQPENEYYYSELLHTDGRQQLRLLGSLLDDFRISSSNEGTEFILIKNFPQEKNSN